MIYALLAVSLFAVIAVGYGLGQDEQNEILEAKNREQTATIDSQAAVIRDLKDDEANLLVQLQSANRKLVEKDKLIAEKDKQIEKVQKRANSYRRSESKFKKLYKEVEIENINFESRVSSLESSIKPMANALRKCKKYIQQHDFSGKADALYMRKLGFTPELIRIMEELKDEWES